MDNLERIRLILKHCIKSECHGCPLRNTRECVRAMAFSANQTIVSLTGEVEKLKKQITGLEKHIADLESRTCESCAHLDSDPDLEPCLECSNNHQNRWERK